MVTQVMEPLQGRWCPSCGVRLDWSDDVCPHCGLPLERLWGEPADAPAAPNAGGERQADDAEQGAADEEQDTTQIPRIESAIPPEDNPESKVAAQERMPARRAILLASVAALVVMGGLVLAIARPWDPQIQSIGATEEADTSMAGFPGTVEELSGQDNNNSVVEVLSGDDATFAQLSEAYEKLARYATRADESEALFLEVGFGEDLDARTKGKRESEALAIDVSNLIETLAQVDVTSGTYASDLENLTTLANWLRNRVDTQVSAWKADVESKDPAADEKNLRALLMADWDEDGQSTYKQLFDENYSKWEPQKK